jgi:hypothetical protein
VRSGLIVNPKSGKSSGMGMALAEKLKSVPNVTVRVIDAFHKLPALLDELATAGVTDLFISSGDGTIQAIQTELAERKPFITLPRLALLPHGTTNMTAADLGFRHRNLEAQASYIANPSGGDTRDRHTLRAANPRDGSPRHGMFLGTGAVSEATLYCQQVFNAKGLKGSWATFATLAGAVAKTVFSKPNPADLSRFDRPFPLRVMADGAPLCEGTQLLMLATTLEKLILGAKPFWGGKAAGMRTSVFPYPVPNVWRWLLPIMYGAETRNVPPGAVSRAASVLEVWSAVSYVIDGEFFDGPADGPLRIETGPSFTYLLGR